MESGDLTHHHHLCLHLQEPGCAQSSDTAGDFSGWDLGVGDHLSPYVSAHNSPLLGPASSASYSPPASAPRSLAGGDVFEWPQFTQSQSSSPHSNSHSHSHRRAYSDQLELGNSFAGWQPQAAFALGSLQLPIHLAPESDFDGAAGVLGSGGLYPSAIGSSDLGSSDFESGDLGPNDLYPPDLYPNDLYANDHLHSAPSLNPPVPPSITITPSDPVLPRHPVSVPRRARAHSDTSVRYDPHCPPLDDHHRRSFSSIRDHVLDLASDHHPRLAKNPATFVCDFPECGKRFTRAYNLRSHQRTHTDERPFECSLCHKAFARQHDRRRHEQLHSGLKTHECAGILPDGRPWGCGKRFARQDALSRHFKSEAGKTCIKDVIATELDAYLGEDS